jgi:hypothetical protein
MRTASSVTTATTRSATPPTPPTMSLSRLVETKFDPILWHKSMFTFGHFLNSAQEAKKTIQQSCTKAVKKYDFVCCTDKIDLFLTALVQDTCGTKNPLQQRQYTHVLRKSKFFYIWPIFFILLRRPKRQHLDCPIFECPPCSIFLFQLCPDFLA